ncbi:Nucleotidyltransferase domain-containing protein [Desulfonema limicola]|uniref:Nucleotidyltransferase domain-containing protein n=1 Tax=Desulfonema limicola TaxID=45656 RepID=A0A975B671_9BACT|nr:nucleotidyltransferase family protein [Desulfonema limicola]QTA79472.1 Nucleotidyltransferase domain-containing protein [Desulfonema limicola]
MKIMINILKHISRINLNQDNKIFLQELFNHNICIKSLINLALEHGAAGLLFYHLKNLKLTDHLSKSDFSTLENIYQYTGINSLAIMAKAYEISYISANAQIKTAVLQGLSVIRLYKAPGLRPMGDLDLLVSPFDKEKFISCLSSAGYKAVYAYPDLLTKHGILIDIHTHILNLDRIETRKYVFPKDLTPMLENSIPFFNHHKGLLCLNPYDNLTALCAHALKHSYSRIIWLTDIYELLLVLCKKDHNAWELLVKRAGLWHQEKIVLYALILVENLFDFNIPFKVKNDLGINNISFIEKFILNLVLKGFVSNEICIILWVCNIQGINRKLRFIMENIFPGKNIMEQIFSRDLKKTGLKAYIKRTVNTGTLIWKNLFSALRFIVK